MINYYQILEVKTDASNQEIKLAYKRLAKKYHPDGNKDFNNEELFRLINDAYHTLINENSRKLYNIELDNLNSKESYYRDTYDDFESNYNDNSYQKQDYFKKKWTKKQIINTIIIFYILISLLIKLL